MSDGDLARYVGRTQTRTDIADRRRVQLLGATLDDNGAPWPGDLLPPLGHWLHFVPDAPAGELGDDGHPAPTKGGFLPPSDLPRRMWAGSRIEFLAAVPLGDAITRRSTIAAVSPKQGKSGRLLFVTVVHDISAGDGPVAIHEEQDIVYREAATPDPQPSTPQPARLAPTGAGLRILPDPVLLFRYSALTFNGHRIHYDADYVRNIEKYPGLVVQGPLIATLLLNHLLLARPRSQVSSFEFRALAPAFANQPLTLTVTEQGDDAFMLQSAGPAGPTMNARAVLKD